MKSGMRTALWAVILSTLLLGVGYKVGDWQTRRRLLREGILLAWCLQRNIDSHDYPTLQLNLMAYAETYLNAYGSLPGTPLLGNGDIRDREKIAYLRSKIRSRPVAIETNTESSPRE